MPKITVFKEENEEEFRISVDGSVLTEKLDVLREFFIKTPESLELLGSCKTKKVFEVFDAFIIFDGIEGLNYLETKSDLFNTFQIGSLVLASNQGKMENGYQISSSLRFNLLKWSNSVNFSEFKPSLIDAWSNKSDSNLFSTFYKEYLSSGLNDEGEVEFILEAILTPEALSLNLKELLDSFIYLLAEVNRSTLETLHAKSNTHKVIEYFCFPEEIKIACSQYLQYFYEFLKDVGIKAKVNLEEQSSGGVLFSITPEDKDEALENIRLALDVYLRLPSSKIDAGVSDIAVQALNAQIFHLKGQLALAYATMQQQQSTIQNLELKPFSPDIILVSQSGNEKDKEPLLGGIIKIGEAELAEGALTINLPALLRWLKKKFGKT